MAITVEIPPREGEGISDIETAEAAAIAAVEAQEALSVAAVAAAPTTTIDAALASAIAAIGVAEDAVVDPGGTIDVRENTALAAIASAEDAILDPTTGTLPVALDDALDDLAFAQNAAMVRYETWTGLNAVTGTTVGQGAKCFAASGTHTDPVVGGTVDDRGVYRWSASPAGWKRIANLEADDASAYADAAAASAATLDGVIALAPTETGKALRLVDTADRVVVDVDDDAAVGVTFHMPVAVPDGSFPIEALDAAARALIPFESAPLETTYLLRVKDANDRVVVGVPDDAASPIEAFVTRSETADNVLTLGGARVNASYMVYPYTDGSGLRQLRSIRNSDGQVFTLTSAGNNADPVLTADNYVLFWSDVSGDDGLYAVPVEGGTIEPFLPSGGIACWGDSLTYGVGVATPSTQAWPGLLATSLGVSVYNGGVGGQRSFEIICRQGGAQSLLTVTSNQIPASGAVTVTAQTVALLNGQGPTTLTGTLAGVPGTYTWTAGPNYTFTRTTAGSVVSCPAGTAFIPDAAALYEDWVQLFCYGRNNRDGSNAIVAANATQIIADIQASIDFLKPYGARYAVIGFPNGTNEPNGTGTYTGVLAINAALSAAFPGRYIDGQSPPTVGEMATLGFTPDATDLTDIAAGCIPTRMRATADPLHFNTVGNQLYELRVRTFLQAKGWF